MVRINRTLHKELTHRPRGRPKKPESNRGSKKRPDPFSRDPFLVKRSMTAFQDSAELESHRLRSVRIENELEGSNSCFAFE